MPERKEFRDGEEPVVIEMAEDESGYFEVSETYLSEHIDELDREELAAQQFIDEVRDDGESGREAAAEMQEVIDEVAELRVGLLARIGRVLRHPVAELRAYQQEKRREAFNQVDNPKVWAELKKRKKDIKKRIKTLKSMVDRRLRRETKNKYAGVFEEKVDLDEELKTEIKNWLIDYRSFKRSPWLSADYQEEPGNKMAARLIKNLLKHGQINEALEVWHLSPDGNIGAAQDLFRAIEEIFYEEFSFDSFYEEQKKLGIKSVLIHDMYPAKRQAWLTERFSDDPDLQALAVLDYRGERQYQRPAPVQERVPIIQALLLKPDRHSFIGLFSPFSKELQEQIDPELKRNIFTSLLESNLFILTNNYEFFKEEFASIESEQRRQIIDQIARVCKYLYAGRDERYAHTKNPQYVAYQEIEAYGKNKSIFILLQTLQLTPEEHQKIFEALTPPDKKLEGSTKKNRPAKKEKYQQRSYNNFLADLLINQPEAVLLNEEILLNNFDTLLENADQEVVLAMVGHFDKFMPANQQKILSYILSAEDSKLLPALFKTLIASPQIAETAIPEMSAVTAYAKNHAINDKGACKKYVQYYLADGPEAADVYIEGLKEQAKGIIGHGIPETLRKLPEHQFFIAYVFPEGDYSSYEKNAACGDHLDHIAKYTYDTAGYPVELTGLLGYRLRLVTPEYGPEAGTLVDDVKLLESYQERLQSIQQFVDSRGPDNKALQEAFDQKVGRMFDAYANDEFKSIDDLSVKEKMLILFISEVLRREKEKEAVPNQQILDLVVEYKYAYEENLEAYIQRSASNVQQYQDETSRRFLLWQELSTVYGENIKHVLRHNIFEELAENGKNYNKIIEAFGASLAMASESFELSSRELQSIESVLKKKIAPEDKYKLVLEKLADLLGPQLKLKGDDDKKVEQQRRYDEERQVFIAQLDSILSAQTANLDAQKVNITLAQAFRLHPRQLSRFDNTFKNEQILVEDRVVDGKVKEGKFKVLLKQVLDMFGSNIKFKNDEEKGNFEQAVIATLEPLRLNLNREQFERLIPKLKTLRNQYRFAVNSKLEELFVLDLNAINRELAKFEEIVEVEAKEVRMGGVKDKQVKKSVKKRKIRTFITKTRETANARMGAYLCIAGDNEMWSNPNYFEAVDKDEETGKCVGLTMYLSIDVGGGKKYLWIGPNPFESLLTQVSAEQAFKHQYNMAVEFAQKNGFDGIVIPPEDGQILGGCTNRGGNFPDLIKAKRLRDKRGNLSIVDFGKQRTLSKGYAYDRGALIWQRATA